MDLKRVSKLIYLAVLLLALGCVAPRRVQAQFNGYVAIQSVNVQVFNTKTTTGASAAGVIPNIGQSTHYAYYCSVTGSVSAIAIQLEGTYNGSQWFAISPASTILPSSCGGGSLPQIIVATGYYPAVRLNITTLTLGTSTGINAWYSGVGSPITPDNIWDGTLSVSMAGAGSGGGSDALGNSLIYPWNIELIGQTGTNGSGVFEVAPLAFNGIAWDRPRTASVADFPTSQTSTARNSVGAAIEEKGGRFSIFSNPAAGSQASIVWAAEAGVRHVADCVSFSGGSTAAPVLTALTVNLRDGASGAGTLVHTWQVIIPAAVGQNVLPFSVCGLNVVGTTNTAMTLEFSAALANLLESVSFTGYNVN